MTSRIVGAFLGLAGVLVAGASIAETGHSFQLPDTIITGRVQKPMATIEIARMEPKWTLGAPHEQFTSRIAAAVARDPY